MASEWNEARVAVLRRMWGAGCTAAVIARELGMTRNAVVGKAHRMGLAGRPSPIKHLAPGESRVPRKRGHVVTHRHLAAAQQRSATIRERANERATPAPAPPRPPLAKMLSPFKTCQYITTDGRPWAKCGDKTQQGSPYCESHHARCHRTEAA